MRIYEIVSVFASLLWNGVGAENDCKPKDCYDLKCYRVSRGKDGSHTIYPDTESITQWQLRRFALAFIHSHSGATGVFRNAFMRKVAEATSCLPKTLQTT